MDKFNLTSYFRNQYLNEGDWEVVKKPEIPLVDDDIIKLINTAYDSIGGHSNYKTSDDISKEANKGAEYEVIDIDDDDVLDAVSVTKSKPAGDKLVATGHDGTSIAKRAVITHKINKLNKPGFYIEVSGRIKDILLKAGVPQVTDQETIEMALRGKDIQMNKDGSYKRKLGGTWHEKIMLGSPLT
jgi:hypothetical protein|tara:strand:+ start:684 stop:1238 length:555 start_codon:yes stop_codon:yes gene_type:complete